MTAKLLNRNQALSTNMEFDFHDDSEKIEEIKENGFTVVANRDTVNQVVWVVDTAKTKNLFTGDTEDDANRVAAAACGVVRMKEIPMDFTRMPNPSDFAREGDREFW